MLSQDLSVSLDTSLAAENYCYKPNESVEVISSRESMEDNGAL